ncbi:MULTISPECIES: hypothetical protein [unclassified Bradyrhizobium]
MVKRTVIDGPGLGVECALTPLGRSLQRPFAHHWTVDHMDDKVDQQRMYDLME